MIIAAILSLRSSTARAGPTEDYLLKRRLTDVISQRGSWGKPGVPPMHIRKEKERERGKILPAMPLTT